MGKREADANAQPEARWGDEGGVVSTPSSGENVESLHHEVESVLHKLEDAVTELDNRKGWRNVLTTVRRGPWILAGVGLLIAGMLLRRKGEKVREKTKSSPGRAVVAGGIALLSLMAKRWAKRLWAGPR